MLVLTNRNLVSFKLRTRDDMTASRVAWAAIFASVRRVYQDLCLKMWTYSSTLLHVGLIGSLGPGG